MATPERENASNATAAQPAAAASGKLFEFVSPANAGALDAALPAPAREIHYVRINRAFIEGKSSPFWQSRGEGRLELPLPAGGTLRVAIEESEMLGPDRFTSTGRIEGRPQSTAIFSYAGGFLHASIEDPELGSFALRAATADVSQYYEIDPALLAPCGGERRPIVNAKVLAVAAERRARQMALAGSPASASPPSVAAASTPPRAEVHVMMAYTQSVLSTMSGAARTSALQSAFDNAIARVNSAFAASEITARVKLVRIVEVSYADDTGGFRADVQDKALTALSTRDDGKMDAIEALRDEAGADVVCLALNARDSASIGLSYVLETPGHLYNPLYAYSVVEYASVAGTTVVAHEFGHVFGCVHDRPNSSHPGAFSYSYGHRFRGADGRMYRDIMAYPRYPGQPSSEPTATEVNVFSNPRVVVPAPVSVVSGVAAGAPDEADNARTIEQTAFELTTFRLQTQAAPYAGALINVSTRAFVGTGDQVLIGGFVVNGTQPKKMLVRGAGPALARYGVSNTLQDPVLQIYSGQTEIARSDNWSAQADASQLATTAAEVGAFPFDPGSNDAALVATLPPGPYTAIVSGAQNTTGTGLVEAYDVERVSNKVVNLSTRGYADRNGKELIGGFVVQGAAGTTKRVLIRVLGPTLARAPINIASALDDPFLAVHNEAGELLHQNDDWTSGADGDDFKPTVTQYGESQIFATGYAPSNRREPAVMMDLPPGIYTVIVTPFELLHSNPDINQPAKPGVGIVEVYEINP